MTQKTSWERVDWAHRVVFIEGHDTGSDLAFRERSGMVSLMGARLSTEGCYQR